MNVHFQLGQTALDLGLGTRQAVASKQELRSTDISKISKIFKKNTRELRLIAQLIVSFAFFVSICFAPK